MKIPFTQLLSEIVLRFKRSLCVLCGYLILIIKQISFQPGKSDVRSENTIALSSERLTESFCLLYE